MSDIVVALQATSARGSTADRVKGSEFEALARLVDAITREAVARGAEMERLRGVLETESGRLEELARTGRSRQARLASVMEEVRSQLERLSAFAKETDVDRAATALRVAGDSTENLRGLLAQALGDSAQSRLLWDQLEQSGGILSHIVTRLAPPPSAGVAHV